MRACRRRRSQPRSDASAPARRRRARFLLETCPAIGIGEWTRGAIDKLDVYRKLGVREVWIWRKHQIDVFTLRGEDYEPVDGPRLLAGLDLAQLLRFVDVRPMTGAVTAYRAALPVLPSLRATSARVV